MKEVRQIVESLCCVGGGIAIFIIGMGYAVDLIYKGYFWTGILLMLISCSVRMKYTSDDDKTKQGDK